MLRHRRLHVLHVTASATDDAADQTLQHLRDQLDRGWTVTLACPSMGGLGFAARELGARVRWWSPDRIDPTRSPARGVRALAAGARLRHAVADVDADIAHLHGRRVGTLGRLALRGRMPTVLQPHGDETPPSPGPGSAHTGTFLDVGVDVTRWRPFGPDDRSAARLRLSLDPHAPLAVHVGSAAAARGHLDLVGAWADARECVPGARLVLVGRGFELVGDGAGITLAGDRVDLSDWFAAADVVVVPTRSADRSVTALQAMAGARSVVVTGGSGAAPLVLDGGGVLASPQNSVALTGTLIRRLADPALADEEGWQARRHVERHHDSAQVSRELARVYPRLVAARRA